MLTISEKLMAHFVEKRWCVSVAESCTGGMVASEIVRTAGASDYFLGGVIAYSNESKCALLGVCEATLERYGAVSVETALEMARGARRLFGSDWAIATSGIAGPTGGSASKPVGLVAFAIAGPKESCWTVQFQGDREKIMRLATLHALESLYNYSGLSSK